jgi:hypothetical protein
MLQIIVDYRGGNIGLPQLISDLDGLCKLLEDIGERFNNGFYQDWISLEEVYAVALDGSNGLIDENSQSIINRSLEKLENLINKELNL